MMLHVLKDLRTSSRHTRQKEFCGLGESDESLLCQELRDFQGGELVEYVISQRPHVSALVMSTLSASCLKRLEINCRAQLLVRQDHDDYQSLTKAGVCANGFPIGRSPRHHRMASREERVVTTRMIGTTRAPRLS
jgi:hypothetical protein